VLHRYVPRALVERPKVGFSVPLDAWLRGPLHGWAEGLLTQSQLQATGGMLQAGPVREGWRRFQAGESQLATGLWAVLMFQSWAERWKAD
jgi:asparagine synthase (glutamine-hydrolysing)